ncbi:hypothetical protein [Bradyrhizobium sp. CB1015]|uniref:hypothetical protein n=1 Tax=Bradyrhizobium sp. CB1015 TaxID=2976822 RepID=UPI0021AA349C|nr:hypothetical protein [Bradyrhizobium sp. CB1015]UWU91042.1 hypothetical protein N2604_32100 [Bradyrhizobium sp. CB1015]
MKWPTVLCVLQAMTFQRAVAFENAQRARPKLHRDAAPMESRLTLRADASAKNPFIAPACAGGENDFASRNIRKSISLTMPRTRRMICASHQRGAPSADGTIFSQRSSARNMRNAIRCA